MDETGQLLLKYVLDLQLDSESWWQIDGLTQSWFPSPPSVADLMLSYPEHLQTVTPTGLPTDIMVETPTVTPAQTLIIISTDTPTETPTTTPADAPTP